jgi:diguanylate cyclase (GGDEF)-like protein
MLSGLPNIHLVLANIGAMAAVAIAFGHFTRTLSQRLPRALVLGAVFGLASVYSTLIHEAAAGNSLENSSAVFVGLGAAFLGHPGAIASLPTAFILRLPISEPHLLEVSQMLLAAGLGLLWGWIMKGRDRTDLLSLVLLGALQVAALLPAYIWPSADAPASPTTVLAFLFINGAGPMLLGSFIERERQLLLGESELKQQASTDALTGLLNRRAIETIFSKRSSDRGGNGMLLIDIDRFKAINDEHGHRSGDDILRSVAACLRHSMRADDVAARVGGEEFAVLLAANSSDEALAAAERLRDAVERARFRLGHTTLPVTVSIGVSWWCGPAGFLEQYEKADLALYEAKRSGRNRVRSYLTAPSKDPLSSFSHGKA